jgi:hypothetical protein
VSVLELGLESSSTKKKWAWLQIGLKKKTSQHFAKRAGSLNPIYFGALKFNMHLEDKVLVQDWREGVDQLSIILIIS